MEAVNIFTEKFHNIINERLGLVLLESTKKEGKCESKSAQEPSDTDGNSCSYCQVQFADLQSQREHYKLDWHRYNLKQSLLSKPPLAEDEFNEKTTNDDLSSISGSESEKEDSLDTLAVAQGKLFLQNASTTVFSIYKCLIFDRKEDISDDLLNPRLTKCTLQNPQWTLLMLGGGHFAGAIFKGNEPFLHKTFHCYTVRAGQGTGQTTRDNRGQGGKGGPKSAGASLRRYNEQGMVQHVKDIVENWKDEIEKSSLIIYRAAGPYNRSVLFGGSNPLLDRTSKKLRTIPFSTRRATFTELKRVHALLATAEVYDSLETATKIYALQKSPDADLKRNRTRTSCVNRAKSREPIERPLPSTLSSTSSSDEDLDEEITDLDIATIDVELQKEQPQQLEDSILEVVYETSQLEDLQEFGDSLTPEQRKKPAKKKSKPKKSKSKKLKEHEEAKRKELVDFISKGDVSGLEKLLANHLNSLDEGVDKEEAKRSFVNQVLDENLNTLLHEAALNEQNDILRFLLDNSADPCSKNKAQQTAYTCTQSKEIRESLKQFAKENPEKFNYNKAQIPVNALTEEELAEKRKAQRKVKKEKEKEKRKENEVKRKEEEERQRFLNLSDRDKRALAAEKRIRDLSGKVITRCFNCAADITGKVPFEYMGNVFCTIDCLKAHRLKGPILLS
ncbi:unnamed protein product [Acanthoscelides obtectus]|uniref:VLRF1 domain-containing protein n=1 Tax=Acanthoscelides obtectus TaxID=200917 RepID=A0A9P0PST9_ACAOB|nr:unnamed protein product [Acanthoscelides obtectus]CAK1671044.1 Ankyrin repeat and zinc finger domain-containing protein 1 [Acanthoscelides obtectus]